MKKLLSLIIALSLLFSLAASAAVCGVYGSAHKFIKQGESYASCEHEGVIEYRCACGMTSTTVSPKLSHFYGDWVITTEATDCAPGIKTARCVYCNRPTYESYYAEGTLWIGISGHDEECLALNRALIALGYDTRDYIYFSELTRDAIMAYQKAMGFEVTGIAYPQTLNALMGGYPEFCTAKDGSFKPCEKHAEMYETALALSDARSSAMVIIKLIDGLYTELITASAPADLPALTVEYTTFRAETAKVTLWNDAELEKLLATLSAVCEVSPR